MANKIRILRNGIEMSVTFPELMTGDKIISANMPHITCSGEAHISGDASYYGYVVYDEAGNGYFPEDFLVEDCPTTPTTQKDTYDAVFMQFSPECGMTRENVDTMMDFLNPYDEEFSVLQIEGGNAYAVGFIKDTAFNRIDFDRRFNSKFATKLREVLDDINLERPDYTYDFAGIRTLLING